MKGESLERVVAEAQLRPGLLVETKGCKMCGGNHRRLLLRLDTTSGQCLGCGACGTGWVVAPASCNPTVIGVCYRAAIREGRLWIVNPFDEQEQPVSKAKRAPKATEQTR